METDKPAMKRDAIRKKTACGVHTNEYYHERQRQRWLEEREQKQRATEARKLKQAKPDTSPRPAAW